MTERLLTITEVADRLRLTTATIRRMVHARRIGVVRPSLRAVRIPEADVHRIIADGYVPAAPKNGQDTLPETPQEERVLA